MFGSTGIESFLDIGFICLVSYTCYLAIFTQAGRESSRTKDWVEKLQGLEQMLRELIAEAGAASSNLDSSLSRRKLELQTLIQKIEELKNESSQGQTFATYEASPRQASSRRNPSVQLQSEMPNDSWLESPTERRVSARYNNSGIVDEGDEAGLDELIAETQDQIRITRNSRTNRAQPADEFQDSTSSAKGLSADIERLEQDDLEAESDPMAHLLDPIAYKVARRMLEAGKEIHIVARKLDLPIAAVREIDLLLRRAKGGRAANSEQIKASATGNSERSKSNSRVSGRGVRKVAESHRERIAL